MYLGNYEKNVLTSAGIFESKGRNAFESVYRACKNRKYS